MRIQTLHLSWFRGAGPSAVLEPKGKSLACFGANGAGKSTFVDALEYLASDGKIDHLAHEYAGKGQINGVRNTHAPAASPATIEVTFPRGATITASISGKGAVKIAAPAPAAAAALDSWRGAQLILRQDEVARFIHATKGEKYSALLPLLGLGDLEAVVDNVHRLAGAVAKQGRLAELTAQIEASTEEGGPEGARATLARLAEKYVAPATVDRAAAVSGTGGVDQPAASGSRGAACLRPPGEPSTPDPTSPASTATIAGADAITAAIQHRLDSFDDDSRHRQHLEQVRDQALFEKARDARAAAANIAESWGQVVRGKVLALEGAEGVLAEAPESEELDCPSCGRPIPRHDLAAHVARELEMLARVRTQ